LNAHEDPVSIDKLKFTTVCTVSLKSKVTGFNLRQIEQDNAHIKSSTGCIGLT